MCSKADFYQHKLKQASILSSSRILIISTFCERKNTQTYVRSLLRYLRVLLVLMPALLGKQPLERSKCAMNWSNVYWQHCANVRFPDLLKSGNSYRLASLRLSLWKLQQTELLALWIIQKPVYLFLRGIYWRELQRVALISNKFVTQDLLLKDHRNNLDEGENEAEKSLEEDDVAAVSPCVYMR